MKILKWSALMLILGTIVLCVGAGIVSVLATPYGEEAALTSGLRGAQRSLSSIGDLFVATLAFAAVCGIIYMLRWTQVLKPNDEGLYPIFMLRKNGALTFHDSNRAMATGTSYTTRGTGTPKVTHHLPAGFEREQAKIAQAASLVQFMSAATPKQLPTQMMMMGYGGWLGTRNMMQQRAANRFLPQQGRGSMYYPPQMPAPMSFNPNVPEDQFAGDVIGTQWRGNGPEIIKG